MYCDLLLPRLGFWVSNSSSSSSSDSLQLFLVLYIRLFNYYFFIVSIIERFYDFMMIYNTYIFFF